ncbi:hypothetical protein MMC11_000924 [Xylographa trunciseda]|nr:hypothetical protein [Xylographa trunciseda]
MQAGLSPTTVSREVIEIDSDTNSNPGNEANPFAQFFDLETIDQAFPDIPDYHGYESSDAEPVALPHRTAIEAAYKPVVITDPEVLYQLFLDKVLELFPDVCRDHLRTLYDTYAVAFPGERSQLVNEELSQVVIVQILDAEKYPTERDKKKKLKRKRTEGSDDEEEEMNYTRPSRPKITAAEIQDARLLLLWEFASVPLTFIDLQLKMCGNLYPAYLAIELAERTYDQTPLPLYRKLQKSRKIKSTEKDFISSTEPPGSGMEPLRKELQAAKRKRKKEAGQLRSATVSPPIILLISLEHNATCSVESTDCLADKLKMEQLAADADAALEKECMEKGEMVECQCCFSDVPIPKSTHCNVLHFFCLDCAQRNAESQIELSRYEINCIDGSGCKAEFTLEEKHRFLDTKLLEVLDRLQQQSELRTAGLENLASCPFCDYAAIYPPVEEDKEFRCRMPECERVSCRLCKADSHLPLTCAEHKKEQGVSERHILEEAMTNAIIRTCPKCGVPIFKDGGCNKMICSRCRTYVCDYCGKDISKESYGHFDNGAGANPSTKRKCPTQDNTVARNAGRIAEAEKEAMAKVRADNPDLSEEDLKIKFSAEVSNDGNGGRDYGPAIAAPNVLPNMYLGMPPGIQEAQMRLHNARRTQQAVAATIANIRRPDAERMIDLGPDFQPNFDLLPQPNFQRIFNQHLPPNPHYHATPVTLANDNEAPDPGAIAATAARRQARRRTAEARWTDFDDQDEFGDALDLDNPDFWAPQTNRYGAAAGAAPIQFDPVRPFNDFGMGNGANNAYAYQPGPGAGNYPGDLGQPYAGWQNPMMMAPPRAQTQPRADQVFPPHIHRRY